jgi:hypothetical protein
MFFYFRARWLVGLFALAATPLGAQWKDWDYELDQEKKPWSEMQAQLPPYPQTANLIAFDIGSNTANRYYVDGPSLSVGEDGVVRYTLVIKSGGGAMNVTFEGIRCDARQVRVYAFGHPGSQWSRARESQWRDIRPREINGHHYALQRDYFCTMAAFSQRGANKVPEILKALKRGGREYRESD